VLLLLANFGKEDKPEPMIPKMSQESASAAAPSERRVISVIALRGAGRLWARLAQGSAFS
jgi:hypothetical protein